MIFSGLLDKAAAASGATWLGLLPWALLAAGAAVGGAGAWGWHMGAKTTAARYEAQKANASAGAALETAKQIAHAADVGLQIVTSSTAYLHELNESKRRRTGAVAKVTADVQAVPDLARIPVPAATARLHDDAVARSAAIAAQDHPM